jgi:hypothetical protein
MLQGGDPESRLSTGAEAKSLKSLWRLRVKLKSMTVIVRNRAIYPQGE